MTDLKTRQAGSVTIVSIPDYLDSHAGDRVIAQLGDVSRSSARYLLDFSECTVANSSGIMCVLEVAAAAVSAGRRISVCCPKHTMARTLSIMGVASYAVISETVDDAIAALE